MKLMFSVAARNRAFSKAMGRVDGRFRDLTTSFGAVALDHPIHEAILVLITDDKPPEFMQEVENRDGFFQVIVGCSWKGTDDQLAEDVFEILHRAVRTCPFAIPDHDKFEALFARFRPLVLGS